jgi:hypothetical protein
MNIGGGGSKLKRSRKGSERGAFEATPDSENSQQSKDNKLQQDPKQSAKQKDKPHPSQPQKQSSKDKEKNKDKDKPRIPQLDTKQSSKDKKDLPRAPQKDKNKLDTPQDRNLQRSPETMKVLDRPTSLIEDHEDVIDATPKPSPSKNGFSPYTRLT